jgi:hypothetical protein
MRGSARMGRTNERTSYTLGARESHETILTADQRRIVAVATLVQRCNAVDVKRVAA